MLKSSVEIKFETLSVMKNFEAQYLEFNFYVTFQHSFIIFSVMNTEHSYWEFRLKTYKTFYSYS